MVTLQKRNAARNDCKANTRSTLPTGFTQKTRLGSCHTVFWDEWSKSILPYCQPNPTTHRCPLRPRKSYCPSHAQGMELADPFGPKEPQCMGHVMQLVCYLHQHQSGLPVGLLSPSISVRSSSIHQLGSNESFRQGQSSRLALERQVCFSDPTFCP